jgi:hypothetical protein
MIKFPYELPTKIEIWGPVDNRHHVDVAAARAIVPECQRTGGVDPDHAITEDVADPRRYRAQVAADFVGNSRHLTSSTRAHATRCSSFASHAVGPQTTDEGTSESVRP